MQSTSASGPSAYPTNPHPGPLPRGEGEVSGQAPSVNQSTSLPGRSGDSPPLANAPAAEAPREQSPCPNGADGGDSPFTNGVSGGYPPFANGASSDSPAFAASGRDARGRFVKGNPGGPGNPHIRRLSRLRSIFLDAISDEDFHVIAVRLVQRAKALGDATSIREVLDRTIGKGSLGATQTDEESDSQASVI